MVKVYIASTEDSDIQIATIVDIESDEQGTTLTLIVESTEESTDEA